VKGAVFNGYASNADARQGLGLGPGLSQCAKAGQRCQEAEGQKLGNFFHGDPFQWAYPLNLNYSAFMRDYATLEQLVVLSNMESINALLIRQGLAQGDRLMHLNSTAIAQMKSLLSASLTKRLK
jgi:hypothetical protein